MYFLSVFLFLKFNCIQLCVIGRSGERTLGSKLIRMAEQIAENPATVNRNLTLEVKRRIRLEGAELESFRAKRRAEEHEAARKRYFCEYYCSNHYYLLS